MLTRWSVSFVAILVIGIATAFLAQTWLDARVGGRGAGLTVGGSSYLRDRIEGDLGSIAVWPGGGHDAQYYYSFAMEPSFQHPRMSDATAAYRHRRLLLPALASAGFTLNGESLLWGFRLVIAIAAGASVAVGAALVRSVGGRDALAAGLIMFNPGWLISSMVFTPDAVGAASSLAAIWAFDRRNTTAASLAISAAALAKEQFLITLIPLVAILVLEHRLRDALTISIAPILTVAGLVVYTQSTTGLGLTTAGQLALPLSGVRESIPFWSITGINGLLAIVALVATVAAWILPLVRHQTALMAIGAVWLILAMSLDSVVWDLGSNAVRVLLLPSVLVVISLLAPQGSFAMRQKLNPSAS